MSFLWNIDEDQGLIPAARPQTTASAASNDVARLTRQVDRLTLASQAMWEILRATGAVTDEHLLAKMQEIDLRDGKEDGKISPSRVECPKCHRVGNSKRDTCMYCGTELERQHVFEG